MAILKQLLGWRSQDLFLIIVKDIVARMDHAMLIVRHEGKDFCLDQRTNTIQQSEHMCDYQPIFALTQTTEGKDLIWLYGRPTGQNRQCNRAPAEQPAEMSAMDRIRLQQQGRL